MENKISMVLTLSTLWPIRYIAPFSTLEKEQGKAFSY